VSEPRNYEQLEEDAFYAEAETLSQLTTHPAWPVYVQLLAKMRLAAFEQLARARGEDVFHWQGVVGTLAEVMERPERIVASAEALKKQENEKPSRQDAMAALRYLVDNRGLEGDL